MVPIAIREKQIPRKLGMTLSQYTPAVYSRARHATSSRRRRDLLL